MISKKLWSSTACVIDCMSSNSVHVAVRIVSHKTSLLLTEVATESFAVSLQGIEREKLTRNPAPDSGAIRRLCHHFEAVHGVCFGFGDKAAYSGPSFAMAVRSWSSSIPLRS